MTLVMGHLEAEICPTISSLDGTGLLRFLLHMKDEV
jgi:hypothetical protein